MSLDDDSSSLLNRFLEDHPGMSTHVGFLDSHDENEPLMVLDTEGVCAFLTWYAEYLCEKPKQVALLIQAFQEAEQSDELPPLLQPIIKELKSILIESSYMANQLQKPV